MEGILRAVGFVRRGVGRLLLELKPLVVLLNLIAVIALVEYGSLGSGLILRHGEVRDREAVAVAVSARVNRVVSASSV